MGEVYLAQDIRLDRKVAVKILFSLNSHSPRRACRFSVDVTRFTVDGKPHDLVSNPPGALLHNDQTFYFRFVNSGAVADPEILGTSPPFI